MSTERRHEYILAAIQVITAFFVALIFPVNIARALIAHGIEPTGVWWTVLLCFIFTLAYRVSLEIIRRGSVGVTDPVEPSKVQAAS